MYPLILYGCGMDLVMVRIIVALCIKHDNDVCDGKCGAIDSFGFVMVWVGYCKGA